MVKTPFKVFWWLGICDLHRFTLALTSSFYVLKCFLVIKERSYPCSDTSQRSLNKKQWLVTFRPVANMTFCLFFKVFYPESLLCVRDPFHGLFWGRISAKVGSWHWPSPSPRESARNLLYIAPKLLIIPNFLLITSHLFHFTKSSV